MSSVHFINKNQIRWAAWLDNVCVVNIAISIFGHAQKAARIVILLTTFRRLTRRANCRVDGWQGVAMATAGLTRRALYVSHQ